MTYYAHIINDKLHSHGECRILSEGIKSMPITEEVYNNLQKYEYYDGELVLNSNYEAEQEQKEKERVAMLSLTRGDVFRGLLQAKGVTRSQLRGTIENNASLTEIQKEMALIDFDEALNFYRGNALIDAVGATLGITPQQLDEFFETNDYTKLI